MSFFFGSAHELMSKSQLLLLASWLVFYATLSIIQVRRLTDEKQKRRMAYAQLSVAFGMLFMAILTTGVLFAFNMFNPIYFVPFVLTAIINLLTYWYLQR